MHVFVAGGAGYIGSVLVPLLLEQRAPGHGPRPPLLRRHARPRTGALRRQAPHRARRRARLRSRPPRRGRRGGRPLGHLERPVVRARAGAHAQRERRRRASASRRRPSSRACGGTSTRRRARCTATARGSGSPRRARGTRCRSMRARRPRSRTSCSRSGGARRRRRRRVLRLATVFGLSPRMRFDLAINVMTKNAYVGRRITVDGGGRQWRPFVHVRDAARAFELALTSDAAKVVAGEVFNVGVRREQRADPEPRLPRARRRPGHRGRARADRSGSARLQRVLRQGRTACSASRRSAAIDDGIREVLGALREGAVDPDDRRWYTLSSTSSSARPSARTASSRIDGHAAAASRRECAAKVEFYRHQLGDEEAASWRQVLDTLFLTLGPQVAAFEHELGAFLVRGREGSGDAAARRRDELVLDGAAPGAPRARRRARATR